METSQVAEARRSVTALAKGLNLDEIQTGKLALVTTEISTNLIKHAGGGQLLLRSLTEEEGGGIEVLALDKGQGILDVPQSSQDGYSTAGTPGGGLGAIRRLSASFDLYSLANSGTALVARAGRQLPIQKRPKSVELGVVCLPKPGEKVSGDGWDIAYCGERRLFLAVDGLGHGLSAFEASQKAIGLFRKNLDHNPATILETLHNGLRSTRGAVLAVVEIDVERNQLKMAGIGNISAMILFSGNGRHLVSLNGTVGRDIRRIQEFTYAWPEDALLVLHSDGLDTHWNLRGYPGLETRHPSLIAGILYRDHCRGNDDVTVLAARREEPKTFSDVSR
jgi:anti-sigma regulatory factor (Ser/Thr protein kinase)